MKQSSPNGAKEETETCNTSSEKEKKIEKKRKHTTHETTGTKNIRKE